MYVFCLKGEGKINFFSADLYVARKANFHVLGFKDFNIL